MTMQASFLFALAIKATLILLATSVVARAMTRSSAAARSSVWASGLWFVVALPALMMVTPAWSLAVLPAPTPRAEVATVASMPSLAEGRLGPSLQTRTIQAPSGPLASTSTGAVLYEKAGRIVAAAWPIAAVLWLLGTLLALARVAAGFVSAARLTRQADLLQDPDWLAEVAQGCADLGVRRRPRLLVSSRLTVPAVCGLLRPALLLPSESRDWSPSCRHVVVLHELAHLKRRDCVLQLLAECASALYWFHPLVHLAAAWHREERERACDDVVLAAGTAPTVYADHLVDLVRAAVPMPSVPAVAFGTPSRLNQRIRAILDDGRYRTAPTVATLAAGVLTATAVVAVFSGARLMAQPSTPRPVGDHGGGVVTRDISAETRQRAAETLAVALRDSDEDIRSVATRTIDSIQANADGLVRVEAPCAGNCVNWHQVGNALEQVLHLFSDEAAIRQLGNADAEQRRAAVWKIWPRSEGGAAALAGALLDDDRAVRNAAAIRLDSLHAPVAVPNWIVLLGDTDPMLRERAAISLGVIGDPRAIEPLGEALRDPEPAVRLQAAKALAAIAMGKAESIHGSMSAPAAQERQLYRPGDTGVTLPELVSQVRPEYTRAAMKAGIQGSVILEGVVEPDGSLGYLRVVQSLDERYGLDMEALHAAGRWKFKPGLREGTPVPVLIALDVTFRLR